MERHMAAVQRATACKYNMGMRAIRLEEIYYKSYKTAYMVCAAAGKEHSADRRPGGGELPDAPYTERANGRAAADLERLISSCGYGCFEFCGKDGVRTAGRANRNTQGNGLSLRAIVYQQYFLPAMSTGYCRGRQETAAEETNIYPPNGRYFYAGKAFVSCKRVKLLIHSLNCVGTVI